MIKGILFDMDGVLVDSMHVHRIAWEETFKSIGYKIEKEEFLKRGGMNAKRTYQEIGQVINKSFSDQEIKKLEEFRLKTFLEHYNKVKPFEIKENLLKLKNRGIKLIVVTGARKKLADEIIFKYFPEIFEKVITQNDYKLGKPNPEPYLLGLKEINLKKEEIIIVEDSQAGVESGYNAKIDVYSILTTDKKENLQKSTKIFKNHNNLFKEIFNQI